MIFPRSKRSEKKGYFLLTIVLCAVIIFSGCSNSAGVQKVVIQTAGSGGLQKARIAVGRVMGDEEVNLCAKVGGRALQVQGEIGQEVQKGEPLVSLDDRDYRAALAQAEAGLNGARARLADIVNGARPEQRQQIAEKVRAATAAYENAKINQKRFQALFKDGGISQSQLDTAELALTQAQAAMEQAAQDQALVNEGATKETIANLKANVDQMSALVATAQLALENTVIEAPVSGKIAAVNIHEGEMVAPGIPLMVIVSHEPVVEVNVQEEEINRVNIGQKLKVRIEQVSAEFFQGQVLAVGSMANAMSKEYPVKISLPGEKQNWKSGMYAEAILPDEQGRTLLTVPQDAVVKRGTERYVMVTDGKKAAARAVVTGRSDGTFIEILNGLKPGDKVIVVGQDEIRNGDPIQVVFEGGRPHE